MRSVAVEIVKRADHASSNPKRWIVERSIAGSTAVSDLSEVEEGERIVLRFSQSLASPRLMLRRLCNPS
jgi:hypothetical protein